MFSNKKFLSGLLLFGAVLGVIAFLLLEENELSFSLVFAVIAAFGFFLLGLKNSFIRALLLLLGLSIMLGIQLISGFMCFDACPTNHELVFSLVIASTFISSTAFILEFFRNPIFRIIILVALLVWHLLVLFTSTAGLNWF